MNKASVIEVNYCNDDLVASSGKNRTIYQPSSLHLMYSHHNVVHKLRNEQCRALFGFDFLSCFWSVVSVDLLNARAKVKVDKN